MELTRDLTCRELVELVGDYLEGRLPAGERDRFEEHIGFCDWCLTYLEQMRETIGTVGRLGTDDLPPALREALLQAFRDWRRT